MDKNKFETYFNDESVIKFGEWHGGHFTNTENNIVIFFAFLHRGLKNHIDIVNDKRIIFNTYNVEQHQGLKPLKNIGTTTLFLVNSHNSDFAIVFNISINSKDKTARLEMLEKPELGHSLITEDERNGMTIKL